MRNVTIILAASGWGAANFATADGPQNILQYHLLKSILDHPDIHAEVYYAQWHLNNLEKYSDYSVDERRTYVLQATIWLNNLVESAVKKNHFVLVIGGDHSLAMGTWSGVKNGGKNFGLIWIDAHMDAHTQETSLTKNLHGMPVSALLGFGDRSFISLTNNPPAINEVSIMQMGIRSYEPEEQEFLERLAVDIAYHHERHSYDGFEYFTNSKHQLLKTSPYYGVSFDIDGIDPVFCAGTGTPADGGLELNDVTQSLQGIVFDTTCVCLEIVEYNPTLDRDQVTLKAMKKIIEALVL